MIRLLTILLFISSGVSGQKVLMGYFSAGQIDYNLVCTQSSFPTPVYGTDATLSAGDTIWTSAAGTTYFPGAYKGYGFSPTGSGSPTHKIVLRDQPDNVNPHIYSLEVCNPNTPPSCSAGLNKEVTLPINTTVLNGEGSDAQGGVTFSWARISGPVTYSISSATVAVPTLTNLVAGLYTFRLTVTDGNGATCTDDVSVLVNPLGTYLTPARIIDLTGENGKGKNGYPPMYLFDGIPDGKGWPVKNITMRSFQVTGPGEGTTPYKRRAGVNYVLDMTGQMDQLDLTKKDTITKIEWFDNSFSPDDSADIIVIDPYLANSDAAARFYAMGMPDSLMVPTAYMRVQAGASSVPSWKSVNVNIVARYIMIRIVGKDRGGGWISYFNAGELRFTGKEYSGTVSPINFNNAPTFVHEPLNVKIGVNNVTPLDTPYMATEASHRSYDDYAWYYDQNQPWNTTKFNADHFNDNQIIKRQARKLREKGKLVYASVRGPSQYILSNQPGSVGARGSSHDAPTSDPVDPLSYKGFGRFAAAFAKKFGKNKLADVSDWYNNSHWVIDGDSAGTDTYNALEVYNEMEHDLNANTSPVAMCAVLWAAKDGWEGRLGAGFGIDAAGDADFKLVSGGTVEIDYDWYFAIWWLTQIGRTDKKFVVDYINFHHYSTELDGKSYISGTVEDRVGVKGETPEVDSVYGKFNDFSRFFKSLVPTVKIMCSERGWDQYPDPAPDAGSASVWTPFTTPLITGYNTGQSKALVTLRDEYIVGASEIEVLSEYWLSGPLLLETSPITFATTHFTTGWVTPGELSETYWIRLHRNKYMGNYKVDSVYNIGKDTICIIRWKHKDHADSLAYTIWNGTQTSTTLGYTINLGSVALGAKKVTPVFNSISGAEAAVAPVSGILSGIASARPHTIFVKRTVSSNQAPIAHAGVDQEITLPLSSVVVDGSGSVDPDGTIETYIWSKISGPAGGTTSNAGTVSTTFTGLQVGTYVFRLTVTDNLGYTHTDDVIITVNPQPAPEVINVPFNRPKVIIVIE